MSALLRVCGLGSVVGGTLLALGWLINIREVTLPGELLICNAHGFILLGVFGLYLRQAEAVGRTGLAGLILAVLGGSLLTPGGAFFESLAPAAHEEIAAAVRSGPGAALSISGALAFVVGHVLLGVVTLRARIFPGWAGALLIAGALLLLLGAGAQLGQALGSAGALLHGLGLARLGLAMAQRPAERGGVQVR